MSKLPWMGFLPSDSFCLQTSLHFQALSKVSPVHTNRENISNINSKFCLFLNLTVKLLLWSKMQVGLRQTSCFLLLKMVLNMVRFRSGTASKKQQQQPNWPLKKTKDKWKPALLFKRRGWIICYTEWKWGSATKGLGYYFYIWAFSPKATVARILSFLIFILSFLIFLQ